MNNKGFTLVELLVTILLLSLISTIAVTGIIEVLNTSKNSEYKILIANIESAAQMFYEDCKYGVAVDACNANNTISIGELVTYGYLKGNAKGKDKDNSDGDVINPLNDKVLNNIEIKIKYDNKKYEITSEVEKNGVISDVILKDALEDKGEKKDETTND